MHGKFAHSSETPPRGHTSGEPNKPDTARSAFCLGLLDKKVCGTWKSSLKWLMLMLAMHLGECREYQGWLCHESGGLFLFTHGEAEGIWELFLIHNLSIFTGLCKFRLCWERRRVCDTGLRIEQRSLQLCVLPHSVVVLPSPPFPGWLLQIILIAGYFSDFGTCFPQMAVSRLIFKENKICDLGSPE